MSSPRPDLKPAAIALAMLLSACGGGGGGSAAPAPAPAPAPPPVASCPMQVVADATVPAGKTASVSVLGCGGMFAEVVWTQVSGPSAEMVATRNPTIALEASAPGVIRMRADARYIDGRTDSATADITVTDAPAASYVTVRADHAVRGGTDTSVRAWPVLRNGETAASVTWTQVSGPNVVLDTSTANVLMFRAPVVGADTALKFRATLATSSGAQDADDVTINVEAAPTKPNNPIFENAARVYPYRSTGAYASVLQGCAYSAALYYTSDSQNNLCPISKLPLLQSEAGAGGVPTVAQIMSRVLVSHDYLGANFEQFLLTQDPHDDFKRLFAGTTAIVIGSHVRPSMYTAATGAIYLDANNLWLTPAQRDIVTEVPDYRLAYDDLLSFSSLGRPVKNNAAGRGSFPIAERQTRPVGELVHWLGRLLYHELGHASDFVPPANRNLNSGQSVWGNVAPRVNSTLPSDRLAQQFPLTSSQMFGLAQVMFWGATPTDTQRGYTAAQVGAFLSADRANDEYSYSRAGNNNSREDLAMLFEEFMMSYRHGVQYDIAYSDPVPDGATADQVIVRWGQRGRIGEAAIRPRVKLVLQHIAPWIDPAAVDALPAPIMMRAGESWASNLQLGVPPNSGQSARMMETREQRTSRMRDDLNKPRH
ncbi:hypothetical protein [Pseudoduganella sp. GCM10020061]|uniref:hypothetical protein n=1 Tax=Pseudoduganella sp. GCM10020061 TaxID=3317345 RepID=UPI00362B6D9F